MIRRHIILLSVIFLALSCKTVSKGSRLHDVQNSDRIESSSVGVIMLQDIEKILANNGANSNDVKEMASSWGFLHFMAMSDRSNPSIRNEDGILKLSFTEEVQKQFYDDMLLKSFEADYKFPIENGMKSKNDILALILKFGNGRVNLFTSDEDSDPTKSQYFYEIKDQQITLCVINPR